MQRTKTQRRSWALFLLLLLPLAAPAAAQTQLRIVPAAGQNDADNVDGFLRRAEQLEAEQRWGEALAIYEDALRDHPDAPAIDSRHKLAKIHYDLSRRYSDSSFVRSLSSLQERQAVSLYTEVLVKIESHYVNPPNWATLVDRGIQDLTIALSEPAFQRQNLPGRTAAQLASFSSAAERLVGNRQIGSRQDAVNALLAVIQLGQQQLQLPAAPVALEFACAAVGALDPYSSYLSSDQLNDVYSQIEGNFVGLGIELKAKAGALQIVKVITGSPAERAGIRAGDRITEVDGKATADLSTDQAADLLQGKEGSSVSIVTVTADERTRRLTVRREHVEVPSVDDVKIVDREAGVGYLKLTCFQKTTSKDLDTALWKLQRDGMRSLIIDLRGNPGGLLTSAVEVADKFVDEGVIVSTRGRSSLEDYNYTAHKAGTWRVPLVVLIDGDSASASEIFAGAIRDHRRGNLVGQRSYGKGSVQGIFALTMAGSGVRLTTAKFYSPNGDAISHVGVKPDIVVQTTAKLASTRDTLAPAADEDATLAAGVQAARRQTQKTAQRSQ